MDRRVYPPPCPTEVFWGESAPVEHSVQIYSHDDVFLDALEGIVSGGLRASEGVIVIGEGRH